MYMWMVFFQLFIYTNFMTQFKFLPTTIFNFAQFVLIAKFLIFFLIESKHNFLCDMYNFCNNFLLSISRSFSLSFFFFMWVLYCKLLQFMTQHFSTKKVKVRNPEHFRQICLISNKNYYVAKFDKKIL